MKVARSVDAGRVAVNGTAGFLPGKHAGMSLRPQGAKNGVYLRARFSQYLTLLKGQ
jgi:hypothetical protein